MTRTKTHETGRDRLAECGRRLGRFLSDQAGASFVITALAFPVVLGMAGLGIDAAMWYQDKRQNQTIADNAAVAGRIALSRDAGISLSDLEIVVRGAAADNGFVHGTHGAVTVNNPPAAGPNAGDANFVEVVIAQTAQVAFSAMIVDQSFMVRARAVSGVSTFGNHCVVALDPTEDDAIKIAGTANVTSSCGLASNSSSSSAIGIQGQATLNADPIQAYGDIEVSGAGASVTYNVPPQPLSERIEDPYASVLPGLQADPSCVGENNAVALNTENSPVSPGRFCGGITINNGTIVFLPGTYFVDNGGMAISGGNISGEGVTFIITAMDGTDLGDFDVLGGTIDLRAPLDTTEGDYPGMLFIQDPHVPNVDTLAANKLPSNKFTGGSDMTLDGALYFPLTDVVYSGGGGGSVNCTLIVSRTVSFSGNVELNNDANACAEAGITTGVQQTRVRIIE
ncbi:MAG: pilus assembly protein TadG-related protein [Rhodospirillales bacterium]|nr:pilus assembly protein TadG-related protein [Rhodospirillales bacterium]MDH3966379.1 pilus assembly protein TadG-related protein [Rhodospirillales bacterium]